MIEKNWLYEEERLILHEKRKKTKYHKDTIIMIKYLLLIGFITIATYATTEENSENISPKDDYFVDASWKFQRCERRCWKERPPYICNNCGCPIGERV